MSEAYIDKNGVARWKSNDRVVPADCVDPAMMEMPGFNFKATWDTRQKETQASLDSYRRSRHSYSSEELAEIRNEIGPDAVDVITGKRVFDHETFAAAGGTGNPWNRRRPVNTAARRERAAATLDKIDAGATVTFPYNGQNFTAKVDKINRTTATVTITKVEGRSNNPRQNPILPGAKGVRVPASILARSL